MGHIGRMYSMGDIDGVVEDDILPFICIQIDDGYSWQICSLFDIGISVIHRGGSDRIAHKTILHTSVDMDGDIIVRRPQFWHISDHYVQIHVQ